MKRFSFSLERVRQWRATQEELERAALEKLVAEQRRLDAAIEQMAKRVAASEDAVREKAVEGSVVDARLLMELEDFRLYARREIIRIERQKQNLRRNIAKQQEKLLEARLRRRLLDRLREKALAEWDAGHQKELEETASELYLAKHIRENRSARGSAHSLTGRTPAGFSGQFEG